MHGLIKPQRFEIIEIAIEEIRPDPRNPKQHSRQQVRQVGASIQTFGYRVPIIVDRDNVVIAGHARLAACKMLGWTKIPAVRIEDLTPAEIRAFSIADNRLTENSRWDDRLLAQAFADLSVASLDFSLEITGFSATEIDLRIESLTAGAVPDPIDDVEFALRPAVTKPGDLWILRSQAGDAG